MCITAGVIYIRKESNELDDKEEARSNNKSRIMKKKQERAPWQEEKKKKRERAPQPDKKKRRKEKRTKLNIERTKIEN